MDGGGEEGSEDGVLAGCIYTKDAITEVWSEKINLERHRYQRGRIISCVHSGYSPPPYRQWAGSKTGQNNTCRHWLVMQ
jgi:hypothetical protein